MLDQGNNNELPAIPAKRYFTIGEVSDLCAVKPHVLRYWEQEFPALNPVKRRGNRRYYQRHDVLMIRQIRALLYDQGFTITGARDWKASRAGWKRPSRTRSCARCGWNWSSCCSCCAIRCVRRLDAIIPDRCVAESFGEIQFLGFASARTAFHGLIEIFAIIPDRCIADC